MTTTGGMVPRKSWGVVELSADEKPAPTQRLACRICLVDVGLNTADAIPNVVVMVNGTSLCVRHSLHGQIPS